MGTVCELYLYKETVKDNQLKNKYSVQPNKIFVTILQGEGHMTYRHTLLRSIAHSIICTVRLFRGKMHSDWFNGIYILQGRWQHGEKVGYCYPSRLEKTLCKWELYVPLVTKGLKKL
jgi:hypothetical protein